MQKFSATDVTNVTLLSIEEAEALPEEILVCGEYWWLQSPSNCVNYAAFVDHVGSLIENAIFVNNDIYAVRPAFQITNLRSSNLKIGDMIEVAGTKAIVISDDMALAKEPVGYTAFRKDWEADNANDYEASDVKKWLAKWWQEQVEHESKQ